MFRVMLFSVAIVAGGIAAWLSLASTPPVALETRVPANTALVDVLVAAENINQGDKLSPELLKWQPWPKDALAPSFVTRDGQPEAVAELSGSVARTQIFGGEIILAEKIVQSDAGYLSVVLTPGKRAVAISVTQASSAGGFVLPNDRVDVLQTVGCDSGQTGCHQGKIANTILENVRVLAVDQMGAREGSGTSFVGKTATVELEPWQAERIVSAQASGMLTLVLRPAVESEEPLAQERPKSYTVRIRRAGAANTVTFQ